MENNEKVIQLFKYLAEFSAASQHVIQNVDQQPWRLYLDALPEYKDYVTLKYRDTFNGEDDPDDDDDILLAVGKPDFESFRNEPDEFFADYINFDWQDYEDTPVFHDGMNADQIRACLAWVEHWSKWAQRQRTIKAIRELFIDLYDQYTELQLNSESMELVIGDGMLRTSFDVSVKHPILMKRVTLSFDPEKNMIYVHDTSARTEIYSLLLSSMNLNNTETVVSLSGLKQISEEVAREFYHPLDRVKTRQFLENSLHSLNPKSAVIDITDKTDVNQVIHDNAGDVLLMSFSPILFMRRRLSGSVDFIHEAIRIMEEGYRIPVPLYEITGNYSDYEDRPEHEASIEEMLAEAGGEDPRILLPLPANREQLEIARRIENYDSVLVQGPPGTGKTHTIANLIGHFLANGKSVLVTSQTRKALTVLKDMVPEGLRSLCVSLLEENNRDMEKSIKNIIEYMSTYRSDELKSKMDTFRHRRERIIREMAIVRKEIYNIKALEFEPLVYRGENYSLTEMAKYVHTNNIYGKIIPGRVSDSEVMPLTYEELADLYATNGLVSSDEEAETDFGLPDPAELMAPEDFARLRKDIVASEKRISEIASRLGCKVEDDNGFVLQSDIGALRLGKTDALRLNDLEKALGGYEECTEPWVVIATADGKEGKARMNVWQDLLSTLKDTSAYSDQTYEKLLGKQMNINFTCDRAELKEALQTVQDIYQRKGKIGSMDRMFKGKPIRDVEENVRISDQPVSSADDCEAALMFIELSEKREKAAELWNALMSVNGAPLFENLSAEPEREASRYLPLLEKYMNWYNNEYQMLRETVIAAGIDPDDVFSTSPLDPDDEQIRFLFSQIQYTLPDLLEIQREIMKYQESVASYEEIKRVVDGYPAQSALCQRVRTAVSTFRVEEYKQALAYLHEVYKKQEALEMRNRLLDKLKASAVDWANAVRTRKGIHAQSTVPEHIEDAWKWKQFYQTVRRYNDTSFNELQEKSAQLSVEYRNITALYAEYSAWYQLVRRCEANKEIQQSLNGWRLITKRIGKGTGKNAARYRRQARDLMKKCQEAVPVWIMTIDQIYENLTPGSTMFDVLIVDEASQCDITSLSLMTLARKIIIVGDDKQVSPLNVGMDLSKVDSLLDAYIKDVIPNYMLYTVRSSLYDLASQTFQPLMLKEHFRCVPDIIGFSNMLSYDYKIKPLRDSGSTDLVPSVISFNAGGERAGRRRVNEREAEMAAALLKTCFAREEYKDKTFGVISMLGDEQAKLIRSKCDLDVAEMERHRLLFGNSAQFQGDERDVIILSLVDSNTNAEGPLGRKTIRITNEGIDDANKKRYNVAVSRARDQLWVIHSLDAEHDLKEGDIRRTLLDYCKNPNGHEMLLEKARKETASPFEEAVARSLIEHGFKIECQWQAGTYYIDIVVIDGNRKIAVECDGERWHSGEEKIRDDMERQTILERIGWKFIRIRGSEFYAEPELTMERVIRELNRQGVYASNADKPISYDLAEEIKDEMIRIVEDKERRRALENAE